MRQIDSIIRVTCTMVVALTVSAALAAITGDQKKELKEIESEINKVATLTKGKKFDEAESAIKDAEQRIDKLVKEGKVPETESAIKAARTKLEKSRGILGKASGRGTVSFAKHIAPIFVAKCIGCHTDGEAKGGLRLDTFAAMEKGGRSGALAVAGNAENSCLVMKIVTPDAQARMPKGEDPLSEKEIQLIVTWVNEGAKFDGADKSTELANLDKKPAGGAAGPAAAAPSAPMRVDIARATGKETVSFMKDVMPDLVDTCGQCHNDRTKRGGLSVMSFEKLMQGGASGRVLIAGSTEGSKMVELLNEGKMPAGNQARIKRKWYNDLLKWVEEGTKFDGDDPKKAFPTLDEREAEALARSTPEQWIERRKKDTAEKWKKTFPNGEAKTRESAEFVIYGDVSPDRLEQIEKWAQDHTNSMKSSFGVKDSPVWKGKLSVFVFKERFGYEEFNQSVQSREVPREIIGHSHLSARMEEALIALQDVGDSATESSPGMQVNVIDNITGAFLKRGGGNLPDWVTRGAGLALANQQSKGNPYIARMPGLAGEALREARIEKPEDIFGNGTFSPTEVGPIGFTLVNFMLAKGGPTNFGPFVRRLQNGESAPAAIQAVYGTDANSLAETYRNSLPAGVKKPKKK